MKVKIEIVRKSWHANIVEMTEEEFNRLDSDLDQNGHIRARAVETIAELVRPTDSNWQDDEVQDVAEFERVEEEAE